MPQPTVLILDVEDSERATLARELETAGFTVFVHHDWHGAMAKVGPELDLLVLNPELGDLPIDQFLGQLKERVPLLEVLLLCSEPSIPFAVAAIKAGAFDLFAKPCAPQQLIAPLRAAARRKQRRAEELYEVRIKPYCSERERQALIARILAE